MNAAILLSIVSVLAPLAGCNQLGADDAKATAPASKGMDPLAEVFSLADSGNIDKAISKFVNSAPDNWIDSTSLEEFQFSEAEFAKLDRFKKSQLQQRIIDRVADIKGFARTVVDRASVAKKNGDAESAKSYVKAINRLGEQLRDADVVKVFQQTGNALAKAKLAD